jgi:hypothetical protein
VLLCMKHVFLGCYNLKFALQGGLEFLVLTKHVHVLRRWFPLLVKDIRLWLQYLALYVKSEVHNSYMCTLIFLLPVVDV